MILNDFNMVLSDFKCFTTQIYEEDMTEPILEV
jgi:hypothetical protein